MARDQGVRRLTAQDGRPRLLLLDDSTSSVDPRVEQAILAGLSGIGSTGAVSVLVVAHRKATIALADEVVFVDQGSIVARGPHAQLLEQIQGYRDLVNAYERAEDDESLGDEEGAA